MFYVNLGNSQGFGIVENLTFTDVTTGLINSFINVGTGEYWTGTEDSTDSNRVWTFLNATGYQHTDSKSLLYRAWAVHDGDIGNPVPLPAAFWLFASGLISLRLFKR